MKIADVRTTTVAVPLQAPLRHALGAFVRTIVEVETDGWCDWTGRNERRRRE
jgi:glucarate dehydratase